MTKIGPNPPPVDAVKAFIEKAGKVTPATEPSAQDEFHAAMESVKKRKGAESKVQDEIGRKGDHVPSNPQPSFEDIDPEIQKKLRDGGYEPPKPKSL